MPDGNNVGEWSAIDFLEIDYATNTNARQVMHGGVWMKNTDGMAELQKWRDDISILDGFDKELLVE